jgi:hypothetical protein
VQLQALHRWNATWNPSILDNLIPDWHIQRCFSLTTIDEHQAGAYVVNITKRSLNSKWERYTREMHSSEVSYKPSRHMCSLFWVRVFHHAFCLVCMFLCSCLPLWVFSSISVYHCSCLLSMQIFQYSFCPVFVLSSMPVLSRMRIVQCLCCPVYMLSSMYFVQCECCPVWVLSSNFAFGSVWL